MRLDAHFDMLPLRAFQRGADGRILPQGKGSDIEAPAPDPSIGQAQKEMSALATQQYSDFKTMVWPEMQAQSKVQLETATKLSDQQYAINEKNAGYADEYYTRMKDVFYPMQDKMIKEANDYNTAGNRERIASEAIGDVATSFENQKQNQAMAMRSYGINPNSGRYQSMENANGVLQAATSASAATRARSAAEQLGWAKQMDAIGLGQGLAGNQVTSTNVALNAGNSSLAAGQVPIQNSMSLGSSLSQGYSGAMSGWNNVGQLGAQSYNSQIQAYNAQQAANAQSSAGIGSAIGSIAGAAMSGGTGGFGASMIGMGLSKLGGSDIRLKENIEVVGMTAEGLTIYEFEYKPDFKDKEYAGHGRFRGVMAHEVERVTPSAVFTTPDGYKAVDYSQVR